MWRCCCHCVYFLISFFSLSRASSSNVCRCSVYLCCSCRFFRNLRWHRWFSILQLSSLFLNTKYWLFSVYEKHEKKSFYLKKNFSLIQWQQLAFCPLIQTAQAHEGKKGSRTVICETGKKNPRNSKLWTTRSDGEIKRASEWDRDDRHTKLCEFISKNANII